MPSEFEEDLPSKGGYSITTYGSASDENPKGDHEQQEDLSKWRLDKRSQNLPHTIIVTEQNQRFELIGTLSDEEINELQNQTTLAVDPKNAKVVLGKGNFGKVRLAKNEQGHYLAIKKIKNPSSDIERESEVCNALLEHQVPNVMVPEASIRSINKNGDVTLYQFMPLADFGDGEIFRMSLRVADLNQQERDLLVSHISKMIITSFDKMHANGIYHLDFKPANLLFDANGNLFISDFGSSLMKMLGDEQCSLPSVDVTYLPPEVYLSNQKDAKDLCNIDSWRLGVTLLQISYPEIDLASIRRPMAEAYRNLKENGVQLDYDRLANEVGKGVESVRQQLASRNAPLHMQNSIMGLLTVDPEKRMTPQTAMKEMEQVNSLSSDAVNNSFAKLLCEKQFAEFIQKVRKCYSIEQEVARVHPHVSEKLKDQQMQLMKFKPYIFILQDTKLSEGEKVGKLRDTFNQLGNQRPQLCVYLDPSIQQKPGVGG